MQEAFRKAFKYTLHMHRDTATHTHIDGDNDLHVKIHLIRVTFAQPDALVNTQNAYIIIMDTEVRELLFADEECADIVSQDDSGLC